MGKITINEEYCKGCGLCINFCPQKLIRTADHISKSGYRAAEPCDPGTKCTGCTVCAMVCPDVAITVYREKKSAGGKT